MLPFLPEDENMVRYLDDIAQIINVDPDLQSVASLDYVPMLADDDQID